MKIERPDKTRNAFNYAYERWLEPNETVVLRVPAVTPNARGVNDIAFACPDFVRVYGTISKRFEESEDSDNALWQEVMRGEDINKTVSGIMFCNNGNEAALVNVRIILF